MIGAALLLFASILGALEIARRSGVLHQFADLGKISRRSTRCLARRGVSDCWKERATRILAGRMMAKSLAAMGLLIAIAAPVLAVLAFGPAIGIPTTDALFDPVARISILAAALCLALIRFQRTRRFRLQRV
jgi:hypothetical protein